MMPPPITTTSAEAGSRGEVSMWRSGGDMVRLARRSGLDTLDHVELRDTIAALPADRRALGHEQRIAGPRRQHAAVGLCESHAARQQVHELVEAMGTDD